MNNEINELERELIGVFAVLATCTNNFAGDSAINSTHATLNDPVTGETYTSGALSRYGNTQYTVDSYQLSNAGLGNTAALIAGGTGITNLVITVERNPGGGAPKRVLGPDTVVKSIRLRVTTVAGGGISECHATAQLDDVIWTRNPATPSQIFYLDEVSIGTDTNPGTDQLYVDGSIQAGGAGADIRAEGRGFFSEGIDTNDSILLTAGDVTANNGSFISLNGGAAVTQNIVSSGGNLRAPGGSITALYNIESTAGDLVADGMLSVRGNGSIGGTDFWATSAHGQFSSVVASGGVSGDYLQATGSGTCNAGTVGSIRSTSNVSFCDSRPGLGTYFMGFKIADGDPPCVEGAYSINHGCGSGNFLRGLRGCRLRGSTGLTECKPLCCADGSEGY